MTEQAAGMSRWREINKRYRAVWTGRGQGVATDGTTWYVTQNDHLPGVSRYSADFTTLLARAEIPRSVAGHVGAVSLVDGVVSIALEDPEALITYDVDLNETGRIPIDRPLERDDKRHLAWCSINPANGLLYSCDWNFATTLEAYDPATGSAQPDANIALAETVHRVQGAAFTDDGRVYLASDDHWSVGEWIRKLLPFGGPSRAIAPGIYCFNATTGAHEDFRSIPTRPWPPYFEEIEGIGVGSIEIDGEMPDVHLSFLVKNHSWIRDHVVIKSFVTNPQ